MLLTTRVGVKPSGSNSAPGKVCLQENGHVLVGQLQCSADGKAVHWLDNLRKASVVFIPRFGAADDSDRRQSNIPLGEECRLENAQVQCSAEGPPIMDNSVYRDIFVTRCETAIRAEICLLCSFLSECFVGWCELPVSFPGITPSVSCACKMRGAAVRAKQVNFVRWACVLLPAHNLFRTERGKIHLALTCDHSKRLQQ